MSHLADWLEGEVKHRKGPPSLNLAISLRQDQWIDIIAALRRPVTEEQHKYVEVGHLMKNEYGFVSAHAPDLGALPAGKTIVYKLVSPLLPHQEKP